VDDKTFIFPVIKQRALFIRKCYHELYDIIVKSPITTTKPLQILLTGTPGIGKSTFLIYFIIRHLYKSIKASNSKENPVISSSGMRDILIFQPARSDNEYYAFAGPNIIRRGTSSDFRAFFSLPTTWYLVDWKPVFPPKSDNAATLFALSPNSIQDENFKDFEKVLNTSLCMPVWTHDELEECRLEVFPDLPKESLNYIYSRVGGVPRSCLESPTEALRSGLSEKQAREKGIQRLRDAFKRVKDPLHVLRAQEESLGFVKVSGRLLHKVPDPETYQDGGRYVWASAYVIDTFVNRMNTQSAYHMKREVMEGLASNDKDGSLGKVFECYVRHLFFTGGGVGLRKRRLYKEEEREREREREQLFTLSNGLEHKLFSGIADFSIPENDTGTIWTPGPNFPCVDIILTPDSLFQITISSHHPVKQEPLRKLLEKLPAKKNISLYFVVPEEIFEKFTFQNYLNEQGNVSQRVPESIDMLEQWVLGVPLKVRLGEENAEQSEVQGVKKRAANEDDVRQPQTPKKRKRNIPVSNAETGDRIKGNRSSQRLRGEGI
jgi:hypothetical protein